MRRRSGISGRKSGLVDKYCQVILFEISKVIRKISKGSTRTFIDALFGAKRIYITGVGRSGLIVKAFGQRLMHLGFEVHLADEITAPGITKNDILIACSGTGKTQLVLYMAKKASQIGAKVIALTASPSSELSTYATHIIHIPSPLDPAAKVAGVSTRQPARSLFEQAMLIYLESIVMELIDRLKIPRERIEKRHANLE